ncbi:class I SAM-dependent methyltransferase [Microbispora bryophytorum]|uniref:Methyltransferase type 11 n=1 Tax=Microbispora bryophytorum TaxID=1460882 RepID=A0A8H9GU96_9ACTN|nr:class I SAM-dependent methyltransferase [Microbispora bryophytorum]MBD3138895.1 class I SAM-dependent methyltransferase [Microbispora bryophytorum]TQS10148.1 class I SAM-dependent methyltransferase [Microbispora bryophytorum]GGO00777.1 methyltransferase type 11 [Microbispora bryophytorum]
MEKVTQKQAPGMEGAMARWYARQRASAPQIAAVRRYAAQVTAGLPAGAAVLEVAPGPGYLAVEMARLGCAVTAIDLSRTFVEITTENAARAGVRVDVRLGDAADLPYPGGSFDLIVCQAAFKNFGRPVRVLDEMHRVLRPGGTAVIDDMSREASRAAIDEEVRGMRLTRLNSLMTKMPLLALRRRAYSRGLFARLAAESAFGTCEIRAEGISVEVRLTKPAR